MSYPVYSFIWCFALLIVASRPSYAATSNHTVIAIQAATPIQATSPPAKAANSLQYPSLILDKTLCQNLLSMEVIVNGSEAGTWLFVEQTGVLYVQREALDEWRVIVNKTAQPIEFKGQPFWPLDAVPGYKAKIDFANQSVELLFAPQSFATTRLDNGVPKSPVVSPVLPSAFLNYDVSYNLSDLRKAPTTENLSALAELGLSNGWGVLTNSLSARNLTSDEAQGQKSQLIRLETTFTKDFPERNETLQIGDTSTRMGLLGRNVYFGGIKYGTNFSLTPGYVSQPLPALSGLSAAPSTVELYVNDVLRQVSNVPTGPFSINNFPILTGSGDARVVVRDLLGRETVIQQSFFTDSQLLAPGLDDWSVALGSVRRELGTENANYGPGFVSGLWRSGISNQLTLEGRAALTKQSALLQIGAVEALPLQLLGKAALTTSYDKSHGTGAQWLLGVQRQTLRFGASFEAQGATQDFRELGQSEFFKPTKLQLAGNLSYATNRIGSFGFGYARIEQYDRPSVTTLSGNYSIRVGKVSTLVLSASEARTSSLNSYSIGASLIVPLDNHRLASLYANTHNSQADFYATLAQNPSTGRNLGWRVLSGQQQNHGRTEVGTYYYGQHGVLTADFSITPNQHATRLGANGALILADGHVFAAQRLTDSFALVEVKDYADVKVGLGGTQKTKTDKSGVALLPHLAAYQNNYIRVNPQNLPISAEIDNLEKEVVPAWRSGVKAKFPVRSGRGAMLKIMLNDHEVAPSGAVVNIEGDTQEFYVARRGEAFVSGLQASNTVILHWNEQQCKFTVNLPAEKPDEIPRLGPLTCNGVIR